jgi:LmbE family N-acetylglucosaminyl deacetylase
VTAVDRALLVVSPHCDDAVFGAGDLIAAHPGAAVVTVFAGDPPDAALRAWDAGCGFRAGDDVMARRRAEDADALSHLDAEPRWLRFRDDQYGRDSDAPTIAQALEPLVDALAPAIVAIPLGLFHRDHVLASDAALLVAARRPRGAWLAFEDAIYRSLPGDLVEGRVAELRARGYRLQPPEGAGHPASARKRHAVACYASQLRGLAVSGRRGHDDAFEPERCWRLGA